MSKQLAISSSFATFALAALALLHTPSHNSAISGEGFMTVQAESVTLDLPVPTLFGD